MEGLPPRKYAARWANEIDWRRLRPGGGSPNGIVEDVTFNPPEFVCFASPVRLAQRIAHSLNLAARFGDQELEAVSDALTSEKIKHRQVA